MNSLLFQNFKGGNLGLSLTLTPSIQFFRFTQKSLSASQSDVYRNANQYDYKTQNNNSQKITKFCDLERNICLFFLRKHLYLVRRDIKCSNQMLTSFFWLYDTINITIFSRSIRINIFFLIFIF